MKEGKIYYLNLKINQLFFLRIRKNVLFQINQFVLLRIRTKSSGSKDLDAE